MTFIECEKLAQKLTQTIDSTIILFDLCGPLGSKKCRWLDAYMGVLEIDGKCCMVPEIFYTLPSDKLWCENFRVEKTLENK